MSDRTPFVVDEAVVTSPAGGAVVRPDEVALQAVGDAHPGLDDLVERLSAFSDATRLQLLIAIHAAPGSSVKALAAATGLAPNTVTQALETLRRTGLVERHKQGRLSCWTLEDRAAHDLLHHLGAPHSELHPPH